MTRCAGWKVVFHLSLGWALAAGGVWAAEPDPRGAPAQPQSSAPVVHIVRAGERLEMLINTSRILTLPNRIPQAMVGNPDLLTLTALSPTQFQISAKKPGVTQVNLWDEKQRIHTVDVLITGDARELTSILTSEFPSAAVKVRPVSNGVLISGYVDRPDDVDRIKQLAEEYYPKVINNITVVGVQQVLLHVKVYEVSRTKLRNLGFDFYQGATAAGEVASSISGILAGGTSSALTGGSTFAFKAVSGGTSFFGVLNALHQCDMAKLLSEPTLVTQSGRPACFHVGGEIPYQLSQGLGTISIEWKKYGTRVDFVPFVLGNGRIRLEVRPDVSEIDNSRNTYTTAVPAIRFRTADTGVELDTGQTLAIAGLVQTRIEAQNRGLPWVSDLPYVGAMFRRVKEENNEIETLILVTPEIVEGMDPHEVPPCLPGTATRSPTDWELYMLGKIERPNNCPEGMGASDANGMPLRAGQESFDGAEVIPQPPAASRPQAPTPARPEPRVQSGSMNGGSAATPKKATSAGRVGTNPANPHDRSSVSQSGGAPGDSDKSGGLPGFHGPIGYDMGE